MGFGPLPRDIEAFSIYRLVFHMVFIEIFNLSLVDVPVHEKESRQALTLGRPSALHYPPMTEAFSLVDILIR